MFRLSIFSFNTLNIKDAPKSWLISIIATILLIASAEMIARIILSNINDDLQSWSYWDKEAAIKYEWYRKQAHNGSVPDVVVIGDSIAARNFNPETFSHITGLQSVNLGWPGMFPLALDAVIRPLLSQGTAPHYLILMQSPTSFIEDNRVRQNEAPIINSIQARHAKGERVPADYLILSRLYLVRNALIEQWRGIKNNDTIHLKNAGFMPHQRPENKLYHNDHQDESFKPIQKETLSSARLDVNIKLFELAQYRHIHVIAIIPPVSMQTVPDLWLNYHDWLQSIQKKYPNTLEVWDMTTQHTIASEQFKDWLHLWHDGAAQFSSAIGQRFREQLISNYNFIEHNF
jgi:hypothetical protein